MNVFYKRHLALFCTIFAVASLCGCVLSYNRKALALSILGIATLIAFLFVIFIKRHRALFLKGLFCLVFALVALLSQFVRIDTPLQKITSLFETPVSVTATVTRTNMEEDYLSVYYVDVSTINDKNISCSAVLECEYNAELEVGNVFEGSFVIDSVENYSETSTYLKAKGIILLMRPSKEINRLSNSESISMKFESLNRKLSDTITDRMDGEPGNLVSALMLGNKELLNDSTIRNFRRAGVSHILAISGMHLSLFMFLFDFILKKFRISKVFRGSTTMLVALFYLALTGFALSTVRAFLMTSIVYLAYVLQDESDKLTTLLFSLFIILVSFPYAVYDIGMWLSFLAVLGIFIAGYFIENFNNFLYNKSAVKKTGDAYAIQRKRRLSPFVFKLLKYLFSTICITVFVNVFICIPMCFFFDEISLVSVISNIVSTPIVTLILFVSPLFMIFDAIGPIADIIAFAVKRLCLTLLDVIDFISSFEGITVSLHYPFVKHAVYILSFLLVIFLIFKFKHKWLIVIPPIVAFILFFVGVTVDNIRYSELVKIEYIGGSESESLLIRDGNQYSIIDMSTGGYAHSYYAYDKSVENCATEIDSYVITHYHNYHIQTLNRLFGKAIIRKVILPYPQNTDDYYKMSTIIASAQNAGTDVIIYDPLSYVKITSNTTFRFSELGYLKRSTHPTFYFTITAYGDKLLYSAESASEFSDFQSRIDNELKDTDFLILGAHGPKTKNSFNFQNYSSPQKIIIGNNEISSFFNSSYATVSNVIYNKICFTKNNKTAE